MTTKPFQLGSISTGTLRTEDLLPAFINALTDAVSYEFYSDELDNMWPKDNEWETEELGYLLAQVTTALEELCPPFVYFGTHPGDASDFGFFPDYDALEEAKNDGCVHGDYCFLPDGEVLQISDHGNILLMDSTFNELWSIV